MNHWAEGDRVIENSQIRIANSDPLFIKFFYAFLKKFLPIVAAKSKIHLILYPDLDYSVCERHWSRVVGLPLAKFFKSVYIKGRSKRRRLQYGIGNLTIVNRAHKEKLLEWIECYKDSIKKNVGVV